MKHFYTLFSNIEPRHLLPEKTPDISCHRRKLHQQLLKTRQLSVRLRYPQHLNTVSDTSRIRSLLSTTPTLSLHRPAAYKSSLTQHLSPMPLPTPQRATKSSRHQAIIRGLLPQTTPATVSKEAIYTKCNTSDHHLYI